MAGAGVSEFSTMVKRDFYILFRPVVFETILRPQEVLRVDPNLAEPGDLYNDNLDYLPGY